MADSRIKIAKSIRMMQNLVSTQWLSDHLADPKLVVLDASWHLAAAQRDGKAEFLQARIAGARFFDIDEIADTNSSLPHMLPSAEKFAAMVGALGISTDSRIICYDSIGLFSAARCWWMLKIFGHDAVAVLDGGLKKWVAESRGVTSGAPDVVSPAEFNAVFRPNMVASLADVASGKSQIADARSPSRFKGQEAEARPGVRPGHVPQSHNVHYGALLQADGTLKPVDELSAAFADAGINVSEQVITSCGSGVTAAILSLALTELGVTGHRLYDGSWAEWGASGQPVALG
jgi:thiosulfate/3-mercaptopyruvate sulfurtransferase